MKFLCEQGLNESMNILRVSRNMCTKCNVNWSSSLHKPSPKIHSFLYLYDKKYNMIKEKVILLYVL